MLTIRHHPELATPALLAWLRPFVRYDGEGRGCRWLVEDAPLPPELAAVARAVCPGLGAGAFSGVILQCYRDGRATTPCHSDAGATGFSFVLSLGAPRTWRTHRVPPGTRATAGCGDPGLGVLEIEAVPGLAVLMGEDFHKDHHHQVAADPGVTGERLSLVFRTRPAAA